MTVGLTGPGNLLLKVSGGGAGLFLEEAGEVGDVGDAELEGDFFHAEIHA